MAKSTTTYTMNPNTFQPQNLTAIREQSDGLTVIFTFLFLLLTFIASFFPSFDDD